MEGGVWIWECGRSEWLSEHWESSVLWGGDGDGCGSRSVLGVFGELEVVWEFVDFFVDVNEAIEGHVDMSNRIDFVVG